MTDYLYRYTSFDCGDEDEIDIRLKCTKYPVVGHTPKGVRFDTGRMLITNGRMVFKNGKYIKKIRWVSNTSKNRFAYPTKKEALTNLYFRKQRQIRILNWQKEVAEKTLDMIGAEEKLMINQKDIKL